MRLKIKYVLTSDLVVTMSIMRLDKQNLG